MRQYRQHGDFDFEQNLRQFDKERVWAELRAQDETDPASLLVSHNQQSDSQRHLRPTENVLRKVIDGFDDLLLRQKRGQQWSDGKVKVDAISSQEWTKMFNAVIARGLCSEEHCLERFGVALGLFIQRNSFEKTLVIDLTVADELLASFMLAAGCFLLERAWTVVALKKSNLEMAIAWRFAALGGAFQPKFKGKRVLLSVCSPSDIALRLEFPGGKELIVFMGAITEITSDIGDALLCDLGWSSRLLECFRQPDFFRNCKELSLAFSLL